jgi:hypothetical protein
LDWCFSIKYRNLSWTPCNINAQMVNVFQVIVIIKRKNVHLIKNYVLMVVVYQPQKLVQRKMDVQLILL